jgi:hypothetical protein
MPPAPPSDSAPAPRSAGARREIRAAPRPSVTTLAAQDPTATLPSASHSRCDTRARVPALPIPLTLPARPNPASRAMAARNRPTQPTPIATDPHAPIVQPAKARPPASNTPKTTPVKGQPTTASPRAGQSAATRTAASQPGAARPQPDRARPSAPLHPRAPVTSATPKGSAPLPARAHPTTRSLSDNRDAPRPAVTTLAAQDPTATLPSASQSRCNTRARVPALPIPLTLPARPNPASRTMAARNRPTQPTPIATDPHAPNVQSAKAHPSAALQPGAPRPRPDRAHPSALSISTPKDRGHPLPLLPHNKVPQCLMTS